jgi:regulator of replication initiation timing
MSRINFVVAEKQKELFEEYVGSDPEFESLSHFFRVAAKREMKEDEGNKPSPEIVDRLDELQNQVEELATEVKGINARLDSGGTDIELVAEEVRKTLQTLPHPSTSEVANSDKTVDELQTQFAYTILEQEYPTTVEDLAQYLEEDKNDIELAIDHLKSNHIPIVEKVLDDNKKHYFKQGERR